MSANVLGPRKVREIARNTGLPVDWAIVWSHCDSGRYALFATSDGRRGYYDRKTGEWQFIKDEATS